MSRPGTTGRITALLDDLLDLGRTARGADDDPGPLVRAVIARG
ncbi:MULTISPECIES: hypothetical protein [unclassified Saccharopolyspora]|nr:MULTISPECIES: hypothetical protein [unclassified Saccharopolyspora]